MLQSAVININPSSFVFLVRGSVIFLLPADRYVKFRYPLYNV